MNTPALMLRDITLRYGAVDALRGVSLQVKPGEFVALLGPSGAGKSSVFRCLTGLVRPTQGSASVHGLVIGDLSGIALRTARRSIGLIFQQHNLVGRLSALDNVLTGRLDATPTWRVLARRFATADRQRALGCLDRVGLLDKAYQRADALSGGQQQRVAIARVLAQEGRVLLADEPVASLDPASAHRVLETLRAICVEHGIAVLCSLHQVDLARQFADRLIGLRDGSVIFDTPPQGLSAAAEEALYAGPLAPAGDVDLPSRVAVPERALAVTSV